MVDATRAIESHPEKTGLENSASGRSGTSDRAGGVQSEQSSRGRRSVAASHSVSTPFDNKWSHRPSPEGQRRCAGSLSVILRPADSPVSHRLKRSVEVLIRVSVREPRSLITEPNLICRLVPSHPFSTRSTTAFPAAAAAASLLTGCDLNLLIDVCSIVAAAGLMSLDQELS